MDDDQLRDALDRRSAGAQFRAEELLPEVRRGIGVSPQPARVARWAPLAGLAAAAVIVVAIVIAFPGGAPSPASTSLDVMTTDAFASALQRGSLDGQTVLVNGGIVPFDTAIGGALCEPPGLCPLGQIENVQPRVAVSAEQVAAAATDNAGDLGTSWTYFAVPVRGTLLLSVDQTGGVEYLGRTAPNGDQLIWSAGAVKTQLDAKSQDLGDVVLVNGWLTGVDIPAPCQSTPSTFPGLPDRNECGLDSWIADDPAVLTTQSEHPVSGIEVQPPAFATYAPDATARSGDSLLPQRAVYAVAKRLYGQFCTDPSQPCWDWYAVGRLSQPAPALATPSLDHRQTPAVQSTPSAAPLPSGQLSCGNDTTLADATGLVESCSSNFSEQFSQTMGLITTPNTITAMWVGAMCQPIIQVVFEGGPTGYDLAITPGSPPYPSAAPSCAGGPVSMTLTLALRTPVAGAITATFDGQALPTLSAASPTPDVGPTPSALPTGHELSCGNGMTLEDASGLVASCDLQTEVSALPPWGGYPHGFSVSPSEISAQWVVSPCRTQTQGSFDPVSSNYELAIADEVSTASSSSPSCSPAMEYMTLALTLSAPLGGSVDATVDGGELPNLPTPSSSPSELTCAEGMTLVDTTGQVVTCSDQGGRDYHSQDAHINVDPGTSNVLDIWWGQIDCYDSTTSYEIRVAPAPDNLPQPADYEITVSTSEAPACNNVNTVPDAHGASIAFASPVDAARVRLVINDHQLADPVPCTAAAGLVDPGDGVNIFDSTDLITSCTQRQPAEGSVPLVVNPTDSSVVVHWKDRPCGVPIHLSFDASGSGFTLGKPGQCMVNPLMTYEIVINFAQPMPVSSLDASTVKGSN